MTCVLIHFRLLVVDAQVYQNPTIKALQKLYDNYIADQTFVESVTSTERQEESEFLAFCPMMGYLLPCSVYGYDYLFLV